MSFLKWLGSIASALASFVKWRSNRELIEAGEEKAEGKHAKETLEKIREADRARDNVKFDADSLQSDATRRED